MEEKFKKLVERATKLSGPLKTPWGVLYGSYHFPQMTVAGMRDTFKRFNFWGVPKYLNNLKVLDIGSNTGAISLECARRGAKILGLEFNQDRVDLCNDFFNSLNLKGNFIKCDLNSEFPCNEKFDIIFCCAVDRYLKNKDELFNQIKNHSDIIYLETNTPNLSQEYIKKIFSDKFIVRYVGKLEAGRCVYILHKNNPIYPIYCLSMVPPSKSEHWIKKGFFYRKLRTSIQYEFIKHNYEKIKHLKQVLPMEFLNNLVVKSPFIRAKPLREFKKTSQNHSEQFVDLIKIMNKIGIAHGDLIPRNILTTDEGIVVVDWEQMCPDVCTKNKSLDLNGLKNCDHYKPKVLNNSPPIYNGSGATMRLLNLKINNENFKFIKKLF